MNAPFFAFHPNEKISHGFFRVLGAIRSHAENLARSRKPVQDATHDGRVLIKRTRALLWFAKPALTEALEGHAKSEMRRASKLLSSQRDQVVTQKTLQKLEQKAPKPADCTAIKEMRRQLDQKNTDTATEKKALREAMQILCRLISAVKTGTPKSDKWPSVSKRLDKTGRITRKAGKKAKKTKADIDFHAWRKKAKRLLYDLELTAQLSSIQSRPRAIKFADRLQDILGEHQDCVVVEQRLKRETLPAPRRIAKRLRARKIRLRHKSRKAARKLKDNL